MHKVELIKFPLYMWFFWRAMKLFKILGGSKNYFSWS